MRGVRLLVDLNETLIRTGEVSMTDRIREQNELQRFLENCMALSQLHQPFELVFMTGNSFEYSRRIEEPLGLKNIPGVSLTIVSENGLIGRSFDLGDLWHAELTTAYLEASKAFLGQARALGLSCYTQGNELRLTLKPVLNQFSESEIVALKRMASDCKLESVAKVYSHPFYFDVDPLEVVIEGEQFAFDGKRFATQRILDTQRMKTFAVGDSSSDIPMFEVVNRQGGSSFWVGNTTQSLRGEFPEAEILPGTYASSVNWLVENVVLES